MSELIRTLVGRIREFAGDRRQTRRRVRLEFTVAPETSKKANGRRVESMKGYTRDISATGLGLIVPAIRIGGRYLAGEKCKLDVLLELPKGTIHVRATSARYEPLEDQVEHGYLIGAGITEMSDEHRALYMAYLQEKVDP